MKKKSAKKIVLFDLDGTILDTIGDIAAAINRALASYRFPPRTVSEVTSFLGNGSLMLMRRSLPEGGSDEFCREVRELFRKEYEKGMYDLTSPYEGIAELVRELNERGIVTAVITNKDDRAAVPMVRHYFGDIFSCVRGVRTDLDRKPNPEVTLSIIKDFGFTPEQAVLVGDGIPDLNVSKNANIDFIPVGYGYTKIEALFEGCGIMPVKSVSELREKLLEIT
ncbi:MAG: HAD hydrolase-like protein [Clostridia bacterium]|nr:HAD hydrolase-like protein [Clostridia bacterium]